MPRPPTRHHAATTWGPRPRLLQLNTTPPPYGTQDPAAVAAGLHATPRAHHHRRHDPNTPRKSPPRAVKTRHRRPSAPPQRANHHRRHAPSTPRKSPPHADTVFPNVDNSTVDGSVVVSPVPPTIEVDLTSESALNELRDGSQDGDDDIRDFAPKGYAARKRAETARLASMRSDVNAARTTVPRTTSSESEVQSAVRVNAQARPLKQCHAVLLEGLNTNWKEKIPQNSRSTNGFISGDCRRDKPNEALERTKWFTSVTGTRQGQQEHGPAGVNSRSIIGTTWFTSRAGGDAQPLEGDRKRPRKQRYTVSDLLIPRNSRFIQIWRKIFVPSLIAWAGTQEDPFGTNCQMEGEIMNIWKRVFPSIALAQSTCEFEIVLNVCENVLNNWRSDIRKAGYHAINELWDGDTESFASAEDRAEYVSDALMGLRFVYKNLDEMSGRGPFCSDLISKVYTKHLWKISQEGKDCHQIGGLALATVAVERGMTFFKTGIDSNKVSGNNDGKKGAIRNGFTDALWGKRARKLVKSTQRLKEANWAQIQEHVSIYLQATDHDLDEENGESGGADVNAIGLHAQIEID
ncbi:hypothetical protein H4582DRAFT_2089056 [Lactarius indigo]|nr:hypothetical protein H4582DRAFT_2089056 [Lactarius indigo]